MVATAHFHTPGVASNSFAVLVENCRLGTKNGPAEALGLSISKKQWKNICLLLAQFHILGVASNSFAVPMENCRLGTKNGPAEDLDLSISKNNGKDVCYLHIFTPCKN